MGINFGPLLLLLRFLFFPSVSFIFSPEGILQSTAAAAATEEEGEKWVTSPESSLLSAAELKI